MVDEYVRISSEVIYPLLFNKYYYEDIYSLLNVI